jgi:hypothetical protein
MKHLLKNILSIVILLSLVTLTIISSSEMEYLTTKMESSTSKFFCEIKGPREPRDYLTKILEEQNRNNHQNNFIVPSVRSKQELIKITTKGRVFLNVKGLSEGESFSLQDCCIINCLGRNKGEIRFLDSPTSKELLSESGKQLRNGESITAIFDNNLKVTITFNKDGRKIEKLDSQRLTKKRKVESVHIWSVECNYCHTSFLSRTSRASLLSNIRGHFQHCKKIANENSVNEIMVEHVAANVIEPEKIKNFSATCCFCEDSFCSTYSTFSVTKSITRHVRRNHKNKYNEFITNSDECCKIQIAIIPNPQFKK